MSQTAVPALTQQKRDLQTWIQGENMKQQMALALPKHITPDRMIRVALTAMMKNPKLLQCTKESVASCLIQCSQLGLEPDGRRAHLIPYENRKNNTFECTLIIDYKGLAELAMRSGMIAKLHADLICEKDEFDFDLGDILHHRIDFKQARGEPYAAYALAVTKTGERFVQVMTREEIEKIRDSSQGWIAFKKGWAKTNPWNDTPGEMWKKTAFRRLSKWLPLSPEYRDALEVDDEDPRASVTTQPVKPLFDIAALPEATPEPPAIQAESENLGDPAATQAQPEGVEGPTANLLKGVKGLLTLAGHTEADVLAYMRGAKLIDESLSSLEEVMMVQPNALRTVYDGWSKNVAADIQKSKKAKK